MNEHWSAWRHNRRMNKIRKRVRASEGFRRVRECEHLNRKPNPAGGLMTGKSETCLDCGIGILTIPRPRPRLPLIEFEDEE